MTDFAGVESMRFVPRGVEVNGDEFVPIRELENCQETRERVILAHTKAWDEIKRLRHVIHCGCNAVHDAIAFGGGDIKRIDAVQRRMRYEMFANS